MKEPASVETGGIVATVNQLAGMLAHGGGALSSGDTAALRRMDPRRPEAAFFKIEGLMLPDLSDESELRWAAITVGLALLGDLHRPASRFGSALAAAGYSDLRFTRLLRADGERLIDELPMVARFLTAKGTPVDWADAATLILSAGGTREREIRRRVARDYYAAIERETTT